MFYKNNVLKYIIRLLIAMYFRRRKSLDFHKNTVDEIFSRHLAYYYMHEFE